MITPRQTRLVRVPDLAAFRRALVDFVAALPAGAASDSFILVPTRAAGEYLRRTIEDRLLTPERPAVQVPQIGTRADFYRLAAGRLADHLVPASPFEREVLMSAGARSLEAEGLKAPFRLRPGLVAEILALYDQIRRQSRTTDDFERNVGGELERDADFDHGARRLLEQTRFLVATYQRYEARLAEAGAIDEHVLRARLRDEPMRRPFRAVVVTVGDRLSDPDGLWPADLDVLTRMPGLTHLDVLATEASLAAGYLERLHATLPEVEEVVPAVAASTAPVLRVPSSAGAVASVHRDREEELAAAARRLKAAHRGGDAPPLTRTALVVRRPLPYLYLAREVFGGAGIPFETLDTLPLAAEPYAAAVHVALSLVRTDHTREAVIALLRSPHFGLADGAGAPPAPDAIAALDVALAGARHLGGLERLEALRAAWAGIASPANRDERRRLEAVPALTAAIGFARALAPLADQRPVVDQIDTLLAALDRFDRQEAGAEQRSRRSRVRAAVMAALLSLREAYARHDPSATGDAAWLSAAVRRWLGTQTFASFTGTPGVHIIEAQAARFGEFDDVQLLGLVEGDWPERARRSVLYPASLLALLEPAPADPLRRERDALNGARAAFRDLLRLPAREVRLSTIVLENDAVVEPSGLLDEVPAAALATTEDRPADGTRVFRHEALSQEPRTTAALSGPAEAWGALRLSGERGQPERFRGEAGPWTMPRISISRLERYLDCPFRFFASEVLRLEEEPEDEDTRTPLERGRFLHELFERFFHAWQDAGHGRITASLLPEARALFERLADEALATLPPSEAALERVRLIGSAISPGIAHRVFSMEADRPETIVERLLEFPLEGRFTFTAADGRTRDVPLRAKADRIDLLANGTFRVIDYKSRKTPDLKQALQLPIYSVCAHDRLQGRGGRAWAIGEAMYVSFEGSRAVVPLGSRNRALGELLAEAEDRTLATLDAIGAGHFPPAPARKSLCGPCPYQAVCRREWVEVESGADTAGEDADGD
ncbi:MAG: PD-(D/E)XK nuclease family protein [Vicinamibacterales bacterium]